MKKKESSNFGIWRPISVEFISVTVRDRGNPSTYYRMLSAK
jgi:hypothetical protein